MRPLSDDSTPYTTIWKWPTVIPKDILCTHRCITYPLGKQSDIYSSIRISFEVFRATLFSLGLFILQFRPRSDLSFEKETFTVVAIVKRTYWHRKTPAGFHLFTNQHSLIYMFDLLVGVADPGQTLEWKALQWVVWFLVSSYVCHTIYGDTNVWTDLLSHDTALIICRLVTHSPLPYTEIKYFDCATSAHIQAIEKNVQLLPTHRFAENVRHA